MLTYILVGAGLVLFGVGSTWFGLRAVAARLRATAALRVRGLWTLLWTWLQPLGCTSIGVVFLLGGGVLLVFSYFALTRAPAHAPPTVRGITEVALVLRDVAAVLGGCGLVLWLAGGMASVMWEDATPDATPGTTLDVVDHDAVPEATDHDVVHHLPGPVSRQHGPEENRQAPRAVSHRRPLVEFRDIAWIFRASLFTATLIGLVNLLPDIVLGHVTVELLGRLVLNVLGLALVMTTFFTLLIAIAGVLSRRDRARRRRMRQGSEPHHP